MKERICINIGNTHVQVAALDKGGLRQLAVADTRQALEDGILPGVEELDEWEGKVVCVVPALKEMYAKRYGERLYFLEWQDFSAYLDFGGVDTRTLGMDRIANALGAYRLSREGAVVVDCGTCINTVVVDSAGHFLGGAILPGRSIMRHALHEHTAQLPLLELRSDMPSPIGKNTCDAIAAGTDLASVGALREVVAATRKELGSEQFTIYATGGDASFFLKALPELLKPAPPFLTLKAVALVGFSGQMEG